MDKAFKLFKHEQVTNLQLNKSVLIYELSLKQIHYSHVDNNQKYPIITNAANGPSVLLLFYPVNHYATQWGPDLQIRSHCYTKCTGWLFNL